MTLDCLERFENNHPADIPGNADIAILSSRSAATSYPSGPAGMISRMHGDTVLHQNTRRCLQVGYDMGRDSEGRGAGILRFGAISGKLFLHGIPCHDYVCADTIISRTRDHFHS
jgi:hypothetical protein